jgi:hypothetical protein
MHVKALKNVLPQTDQWYKFGHVEIFQVERVLDFQRVLRGGTVPGGASPSGKSSAMYAF